MVVKEVSMAFFSLVRRCVRTGNGIFGDWKAAKGMRSEPCPLEVYPSAISVSSAFSTGRLRSHGVVDEGALDPALTGGLGRPMPS